MSYKGGRKRIKEWDGWGNFAYCFTKKISEKVLNLFPSLLSYGGGNTYRKVVIGKLTLYFHSSVVLAFEYEGKLYCPQNETKRCGIGIYLNIIEPDKTKRMPQEEWTRILMSILHKHNLIDAVNLMEAVC